MSVSSLSARPSPINRRVGVHDFTFEACSSFTRVTACKIACPPKGGLLSRGFDLASHPTEPLGSYHVLPTTTCMDPPSTGDLRRWGALLTTGWACSSGSSDGSAQSTGPVNSRSSTDESRTNASMRVARSSAAVSPEELLRIMASHDHRRESSSRARRHVNCVWNPRSVWGPGRTGPPCR